MKRHDWTSWVGFNVDFQHSTMILVCDSHVSAPVVSIPRKLGDFLISEGFAYHRTMTLLPGERIATNKL